MGAEEESEAEAVEDEARIIAAARRRASMLVGAFCLLLLALQFPSFSHQAQLFFRHFRK